MAEGSKRKKRVWQFKPEHARGQAFLFGESGRAGTKPTSESGFDVVVKQLHETADQSFIDNGKRYFAAAAFSGLHIEGMRFDTGVVIVSKTGPKLSYANPGVKKPYIIIGDTSRAPRDDASIGKWKTWLTQTRDLKYKQDPVRFFEQRSAPVQWLQPWDISQTVAAMDGVGVTPTISRNPSYAALVSSTHRQQGVNVFRQINAAREWDRDTGRQAGAESENWERLGLAELPVVPTFIYSFCDADWDRLYVDAFMKDDDAHPRHMHAVAELQYDRLKLAGDDSKFPYKNLNIGAKAKLARYGQPDVAMTIQAHAGLYATYGNVAAIPTTGKAADFDPRDLRFAALCGLQNDVPGFTGKAWAKGLKAKVSAGVSLSPNSCLVVYKKGPFIKIPNTLACKYIMDPDGKRGSVLYVYVGEQAADILSTIPLVKPVFHKVPLKADGKHVRFDFKTWKFEGKGQSEKVFVNMGFVTDQFSFGTDRDPNSVVLANATVSSSAYAVSKGRTVRGALGNAAYNKRREEAKNGGGRKKAAATVDSDDEVREKPKGRRPPTRGRRQLGGRTADSDDDEPTATKTNPNPDEGEDSDEY